MHRNKQEETWGERWIAFKSIHPILAILFWTHGVTLGIYPAVIFWHGVGVENVTGFPLIVLLYNIGDLIGKYCYKMKQFKDSFWFYVYAFSRNLGFQILIIVLIYYQGFSYFKQGIFIGI